MSHATQIDDPPVPTAAQARALYRQMALIRAFEERVLEMRMSGEVEGVIHPYLGQEAVAVGVCAALTPDDALVSTHRGHGHCIAKGADPARMMAELLGRQDGYSRGKGGSMHIADFGVGMLGANGIVAAGLPIAAGAGLAAMLKGQDTVAVSMFGEGAVGAGPFHESLNVAALWRLPVLFVCENNGVAQSTVPEDGLAARSVAALAEPYGLPSEIVDGNDVLQVRAAAWRAVQRARRGDGASLIEARTFRMAGHAFRGAPVPEQRDPTVMRQWLARDPILAFGRLLEADRTLTRSETDALRLEAADEVTRAIEFAKASPYPPVQDALLDLFADRDET